MLNRFASLAMSTSILKDLPGKLIDHLNMYTRLVDIARLARQGLENAC